jgi:hypothetical protein
LQAAAIAVSIPHLGLLAEEIGTSAFVTCHALRMIRAAPITLQSVCQRRQLPQHPLQQPLQQAQ